MYIYRERERCDCLCRLCCLLFFLFSRLRLFVYVITLFGCGDAACKIVSIPYGFPTARILRTGRAPAQVDANGAPMHHKGARGPVL